MTTQEKRDRKNQRYKERYASDPVFRAKCQLKARKAIPRRNEKRKVVSREKAAAEGRTLGYRYSDNERINREILALYELEKRAIFKADHIWLKHEVMLSIRGALAARKQWRRHKNTPGYRQRKALRSRLWKFTRMHKRSRMRHLVGCTREQFNAHLERQFTKGMTWENYGEWEMDHIIPCTAFDLTNREEQAKCFHYTNIRPMWKRDNIIKGNKIHIHQPELTLSMAYI